MPTSAITFISYSHDSPEHVEHVVQLATRLRNDGVEVELDQWVEAPPEGWPQWMDRQIRKAQFVLVICTEIYNRRAQGEERPGVGRGIRWESLLTYQHIYDANSENTRFIPVLCRAEDAQQIPTPLRGTTHYDISSDAGYLQLYRRLTNQPSRVKPPLGAIKPLPPISSQPQPEAAPEGKAVPGAASPPTPRPLGVSAGGYTRPSLREFIMNVLVSDSDLEALCLDYFPEVKQRYTGSMDRHTKVNLLLEHEDNGRILKALEESHSARYVRFQSILRRSS